MFSRTVGRERCQELRSALPERGVDPWSAPERTLTGLLGSDELGLVLRSGTAGTSICRRC